MRANLISSASEHFHHQWHFCDSNMQSAINNCVASFKSSDSINSPPRSIKKKVEQYVDAPFRAFVLRFGGWFENKELSNLLELEMGDADFQITKWSKFVMKNSTDKNMSSDIENIFLATVDAVRDFLKICYFYVPTRKPVLKMELGELVVGEKRVDRASKKQFDLPHYLIFFHENTCELCAEFTETEELKHLAVAQSQTLSQEVNKLLKQGIELIETGYSSRYCKSHSNQDHLSYKRGHRKRITFYILMRLIIEARRFTNQKPLLIQDLKLMALELIQKKGASSKVIKQAKALLSIYFEDSEKRTSQVQKLKKDIVECFAKLVNERP